MPASIGESQLLLVYQVPNKSLEVQDHKAPYDILYSKKEEATGILQSLLEVKLSSPTH